MRKVVGGDDDPAGSFAVRSSDLVMGRHRRLEGWNRLATKPHSHAGGAERLAFPQNAQLSRDETGCRKSFARTVKLALKTQAP